MVRTPRNERAAAEVEARFGPFQGRGRYTSVGRGRGKTFAVDAYDASDVRASPPRKFLTSQELCCRLFSGLLP